MKTRIISLLFACFLFIDAYSNHIAGIELRYEGLGNGQYDVFIHVYKECGGNNPAAQPLIARCSSNTVTAAANTQTKILVRTLNECGTGCTGEIEEHVWKTTIDLSSYQCCQWLLSYEMIHSRNNGQIYFVTAELNKCAAPNASFSFQEAPTFFIAQNHDVSLNMGIGGLNGADSVSYELTQAHQSLGQSITYTGNFSPVRPITFFGFPNQNLQWPAGFRLNQDGYILFRPTLINQVATIVVKVLFWKVVNGQMEQVGWIVRDFEVTVLANGYQPPEIAGLTQYPAVKEIYLCAGDTSVLWFNAKDDDGDSMEIELIQGDSGVVLHKDSLNSTGKIGFEVITLAGDTNGVFRKDMFFRLNDNSCPYPLSSVYRVRFLSSKSPEMISAFTTQCDSAKVALTVISDSNSQLYTKWRFLNEDQDVVHSGSNLGGAVRLTPGKYELITECGFSYGCKTTFDSSFEILPNFKFELQGADTICEGDTDRITLVDLGSTGNFSSAWTSSLSQFWTDSGAVAKAWPRTNSLFWMSVTDAGACQAVYPYALHVVNTPTYSLQNSVPMCENVIQPIGPSGLQKADSLVWFDDVKTIKRVPAQTGWHSFSMYTWACAYSDSVYVNIQAIPKILFPSKDTLVCAGSPVKVGVSGGTGTYTYYWNNISRPSEMPVYVSSNFFFLVQDQNGCRDTQALFITVPTIPNLTFDPPTGSVHLCHYDSLEVEAIGVPNGALLTWNGTTTGPSSFLVPGTSGLLLRDLNNCPFSYSYVVNSAPNPDASFTSYEDSGKVFFQPLVISGTHTWFFGDGDSSALASPSHHFVNDGDYTVTHYIRDDQYSCRDTATDLISIIHTGLSKGLYPQIEVFPNPFSDRLEILVSEQIEEVMFVDALGRTYPLEWSQSNGRVLVSVRPELPSGVYFLRVSYGEKTRSVELWKR